MLKQSVRLEKTFREANARHEHFGPFGDAAAARAWCAKMANSLSRKGYHLVEEGPDHYRALKYDPGKDEPTEIGLFLTDLFDPELAFVEFPA